MSDYNFSGGKLKFKGAKRKKEGSSTKDKKSKRRLEEVAQEVDDDDADQHGGFWAVASSSDIKAGAVAIQVHDQNVYMSSVDNGYFTIGPPHVEGEGPAPEEILTLMKPPDSLDRITLKSGYDRFLSIDSDGRVIARSEAAGIKELWEVVFDEGKMAIQAWNNCFISFDMDKEGYLTATSLKAGEHEICKLRTNREKDKPIDWTPSIDKGDLGDAEISYVKKFQSFEDRRLRVNEGDRSVLHRARDEGNLHEALLDRRAKMKSDRYCTGSC